jgi:hypothetical protein
MRDAVVLVWGGGRREQVREPRPGAGAAVWGRISELTDGCTFPPRFLALSLLLTTSLQAPSWSIFAAPRSYFQGRTDLLAPEFSDPPREQNEEA